GGTIRPDAKVFTEFDDELAAAMREETVLFFDAIVREDRSVLEILDANYTFVNERLAAHYQIDGIKGSQMRRVQLEDPVRGGVLPTGEKFRGPMELKKLLLDQRRPEFLRNLCKKALGYALGRQIQRVDLCVVEDCVRALEQGDFRASRLLEAIVLSYPFSHRY